MLYDKPDLTQDEFSTIWAQEKRRKRRELERRRKERYWVGLDGEGVTIGEPSFHHGDSEAKCVLTGERHLYTSMSWRRADGTGKDIFDDNGLSTERCLEFILAIPKQAKIMAYGFGYDLTKILEDLPTRDLYRLTHANERLVTFLSQGKTCFRYLPVVYRSYVIDLFNTRFKVGRLVSQYGRIKGADWRTVFDISKFYQCPFVTACERWEIGTPEERATMRKMKDDRRNLGAYTETQILDYSNKECAWGSELAQKLDDAHLKIDIHLGTQYYGAGSTAKALLRKWEIADQIPELLKEIEIAAAYAFFGGRFENALRGKVEQPVYDWDIAGAYPYQVTFLPCLMCGTWTRTRDIERVRAANAALVRYSLSRLRGGRPSWGPFPFRDKDGTIPFPVESAGGWVHKDEFFAGQRLAPNVRFHEAWVYETQCTHRPFAKVPSIYLERLRIGKEVAGIVLKLGTNAIAGSIMQTVGMRKYYNAVWAGMITSGTRAQLLDLMAAHERLEDVIMCATDGLWSVRQKVTPIPPRETGTDIEVTDPQGKKSRKPLGSWELGTFEKGVFMARPGIYFPLGIKDEKGMKDLKARGIGVRTLYEHRNALMTWYEKYPGAIYHIQDKDPLETVRRKEKPKGLERFIGMRGAVDCRENSDGTAEYNRRSTYGLWSLQSRQIDFKSLPKRHEGDGYRLVTRSMPTGQTSMPYVKGAFTPEELTLELGDHDDDQDDFE